MASSSSLVGNLVALNKNNQGEEDASIPKIPILTGSNIVGRNSLPVSDKRLSRQHLSITASLDGAAHVFVDGTNPVVVRSQDRRKKLLSREKLTIKNGDIIELIPGHHFFKYVVSSGEKTEISPNKQKRPLTLANEVVEGEMLSQKRTRQVSEDEAFARKLQAELNNGGMGEESTFNASCNFNLAKDKLPLSFRLMRVKGLPAWANTNAVSIGDVIQGNVLFAVLSNYMVDIDWLLSACPTLNKVPNVLLIHGEGDGKLEYMKRNKLSNWIMHKPPLPIAYGTHHSKAMFLVYPQGVRIIVHTANLIYVDWNNKSQGLWMQDFPWKDQSGSTKGCAFETDLIDYLSALKWPGFSINLPNLGKFTIDASFFKKFDYSNATVRLIASVPGYHSGPNLKKWGHMKLRTVLQDFVFDKAFEKSPLVYQFSSLGSLDEKWMAELAFSMSCGVSEDKKPLGLGEPLIIWPTVEDVRCSLEGYGAGNAIPSPQKNVDKQFLKKYWAKWKADHTGRCSLFKNIHVNINLSSTTCTQVPSTEEIHAMPHIKTFTRYNGQNLAWFLLTSSNLSKAAWGALQKNNSQLMVRSYELGVLFLPSVIKNPGRSFSCTDNGNACEDKCGSSTSSEVKRTKLATLTSLEKQNTGSCEVIRLAVPYELPPQRYTSEDIPWSWDRRYAKKDVHGQVWPR